MTESIIAAIRQRVAVARSAQPIGTKVVYLDEKDYVLFARDIDEENS